MNPRLPGVLDAFTGLDVLVVGEAMLDGYLEGTSGRLCQEAPVPVVSVASRRDAPGGAANAAANARTLGARVRLLSVVGDDPEGSALRQALAAQGVSADHLLVRPGRRTLAKQRVLASGQLLVRFDQGDTAPVRGPGEEALIDRLSELFGRSDAVIVSDYGYGILTPRVRATLAGLQARSPRTLVVDSKDLAAYRGVGPTAVKPNYHEALRLLGLAPECGPQARSESPCGTEARAPAEEGGRVGLIAARGRDVLEVTGARIAAVTLDTDGALVFERDRPPYRTYARPNPHSRAAGAGDTFVSALALALAAGADTPAAAELAAAAAAAVVAKDGTALCSAAELRAHLSAGDKPSDLAGLAARLDLLRRQGRRIVLTNGCFDILHRGHVTYLSRAKALGDVLVVGVNSDESIRRLKGPDRPINTLEDRVGVLAALSCVDHVVAFHEDTPHELVRAVRPHVFVKGGDYTRDRLPEAALVEELGGVVHILPFVADRSTTGVIERIRAAPDGAPRPLPAPRLAVAASLNGHPRNGHAQP
jgi:D-beta-D-heptose 7-phosphate kinase/D-beta-D-heptose 1-phosphate adenosyltransferase